MAEKLKKTNPELLRQRRALSRYERFLPTLVLKQQLIQAEILGVRRERSLLQVGVERRLDEIDPWLGYFGESLPGPITRLVSVAGVKTGERSVAGIRLPVLQEISWHVRPYSLTASPSWVEAGIEFVKELLKTREALRISISQELVLALELRKVTQRVNLFEKVMIPAAREAIRVIRIALAEEQTAAVGRAKIAKAKKELATAGAGGVPVIAAMEKVLVAGRALDRRAVLEAIRRAGVVHVEPVERREMIALPAVKEELVLAGRALEILEVVAATAVPCSPDHTPPVVIERVLALSAALERTRVQRQDLLRERQQAAPWGRLGSAYLEALLTAGLHVEFFTCPAGAAGAAEAVRAEVRHLAGRVKELEHWVAVSRGKIVIASPALQVAIPNRDAAAIDSVLGELAAEEGRLSGELAGFKPCRDDLRQYRFRLQDQQRLLEVESGLHDAGEIFVLKGWVPSRIAQRLATALGGLEIPIGLRLSPPDETDQPPTRFENRAWCRPIENLYRLLGVFPGYREKDISFLFLPALTVFAGFLIADAGYAAVALLALMVGYRTLVRRGAPGAVLNLSLILCGGVFVFGALTNTWFGESLLKLTPFDGATESSQILLKRLCFLLGAVHLSLAHLLKIWGKPPSLSMLAEAGWVLFIWAMLALVNKLVLSMPAPVWMIPLFQVSLAMVLLFTAPSRNPIKALGAGLGSIALNAAAFLSDIISYIRLWAVGLAGGILAASFNQLAGDLPLLVMILVLVPAHLLNLSLGLVAIFAHGVRLNLLEFSNHLGMEWSGREYQPFSTKATP